ncbi:hypothetical protein E4U24_000024 [Claviceps purpurea]|nr:hypothetical protein E4U38_002594 [Claviceps purpurea]KAG6259709.1 hypothetical protein E4U24_000024 [Claviceps purpurea]
MSQLVTALRISWHRRAALGGPCLPTRKQRQSASGASATVAQIAVKFPHVSTVTHGGSRLWRVRVLRVLHGVHGFRFTFDPTFLDYRPNAESTFAMRLRLISHGVEARKTKAALHNGVLALALEVGHIQNFRHTDAPSAPPALRSAEHTGWKLGDGSGCRSAPFIKCSQWPQPEVLNGPR